MRFPKRACQTCKKRRVKCDALQPVCGRCWKANRACTWDPNDQSGLHFKNENAFAQGQPRRPRRVKEPLPEPMALTAPSTSNVPTALSIPIELHAFHYWVENWTFRLNDLPDIGHEYSTYVFFHWIRARPGSSLRLALSALSQAVYGRARKAHKVVEDADRVYAQTIVTTHKQMKELSNESIDQLLLTIMLMSSYENIMWGTRRRYTQDSSSASVDEVGSRFWQSVCHLKGAWGLLKLRRQQGSAPNLPLDRVVRRQLLRTAILRGITVPPWLRDGAEYGESGPALEADSLMVRVAALRAKSLTLFSGKVSARRSEDFAAEAQELDTAFASWSRAAPEEWKFSTQPSPANPHSPESDLLYNGPVHVYTSHGHASLWNRYRAARLIVNSIRIRSLANLQRDPSHRSLVLAEQDLGQKNVASLANDLCGGVSFFFKSPSAAGGGAGPSFIDIEIVPKMAMLLAWPLAVAVSTESVPEPQKQWLKRMSKAAADSMGDAILESVAEQGEFRF